MPAIGTDTPNAVMGFQEGFEAGFDAGVTQVQVIVFFLFFSYIVQAVLLGIGRRLDMDEQWYTQVLPVYRHGAFVIRLGLCAALLTRTYLIL